jgi:hypothetical protein
MSSEHRLDLGFFNGCVVEMPDIKELSVLPADIAVDTEKVFYCTNYKGNTDFQIATDKTIHIPTFKVTVSSDGNSVNGIVRDDMLADIGMKVVRILSHLVAWHNLTVSLDNIVIPIKRVVLTSTHGGGSYGWADVGIAYFLPKTKTITGKESKIESDNR